MEPAAFVSVVVAAGRSDLRETLRSLKEQDYPDDQYEVIVVSELDRLELDPMLSIRLVKAPGKNPAHKRNLGAAAARGGLLGFIDDDAMAPRQWLSRAAALFEAHANAAGVGGPNLSPAGAGWRQRLTDALLTLPVVGSGNPSYGRKGATRNAQMGDIHLVNMFVRREVFEAVGGLNESVGYGGEDTEFIYATERQLGRPFIYASDLFVYHHRRAFGPAYLKQRFRLRANTGALSVAFSGMYARKPSFWLLVVAPPALLGLLLTEPPFALFALILYAAAVFGISLFNTPLLALPVTLCAPLHHLTYAAGLYWGIASALLRPGRLRALRERRRVFAEKKGSESRS
jgi:GT2 family glycosyltransferase